MWNWEGQTRCFRSSAAGRVAAGAAFCRRQCPPTTKFWAWRAAAGPRSPWTSFPVSGRSCRPTCDASASPGCRPCARRQSARRRPDPCRFFRTLSDRGYLQNQKNILSTYLIVHQSYFCIVQDSFPLLVRNLDHDFISPYLAF